MEKNVEKKWKLGGVGGYRLDTEAQVPTTAVNPPQITGIWAIRTWLLAPSLGHQACKVTLNPKA